jgi:hypothetical protein
MKFSVCIASLAIAAVTSFAAIAHAETVSYSANLNTSKGNPVTDILILESTGAQPARASVYPFQLPGTGPVVITHDAPAAPTRSLIIGLTEGIDENGADKTQIVMFLDRGFAAANAGIPFSSVFSGVRHSETITRLKAATAGDATALAWFADTFFAGPAAQAAFASGGPFAIAEFTSLKIIGKNATAGNWLITSFLPLTATDPNAQSGRPTALIGETARIDTGPFDIELSVSRPGPESELAFDKSVFNNTGVAWNGFRLVLGKGTGANFVPSTAQDGLSFVPQLNNRETTGAFPTAVVEEDTILFTGALGAGGTARFVVFVNTAAQGAQLITLRQIALPAPVATTPVPTLGQWSLAGLAALLVAFAGFRLRRPARRY